MTVRTILKMGDPRLLRIAPPVPAADFDSDAIHLLVSDMFDTMHAVNGAGLAAPQIGVDVQLVIFGTDAPNPRYPDAPLVPRLSFGVLRAVLPALSIGVRAQAVPFAPLNHDGERVARAATVTLAPVACLLAPVSGSVRVGGCLSAEVGLTLARGLGLDQNGHGARAYGAIGISPSVLLGRRASVRLSVDLDVRITQPRFEVTGLGEVGRARSVGFGGTCAFFFWAS